MLEVESRTVKTVNVRAPDQTSPTSGISEKEPLTPSRGGSGSANKWAAKRKQLEMPDYKAEVETGESDPIIYRPKRAVDEVLPLFL